MDPSSKDIIDIATLCVAMGAFGAAAWQGWIARRHNRLSVRPALTWRRSRSVTTGGIEIEYSVTNTGVGPALVKDVYFTIHGDRLATVEDQDVVETLVQHVLGDSLNFHLKAHGLPGTDAAMAVGERIVIAHLLFPTMSPETAATVLPRFVEHVGFHVHYESLYAEKHKLTV